MSRAPTVTLLAVVLAGCSSGASVEMSQVGAPAGPGCPAPERQVFAYRTCVNVFDPFCLGRAPYQIMQDAASTAPLLALGPGPLAAGALMPVALGAAQGLQQRLAGALSAETQLLDHRRALLEFGQILATAPQGGAAGGTLPSQNLQAALGNRLARILVGEGPGTLAAGPGVTTPTLNPQQGGGLPPSSGGAPPTTTPPGGGAPSGLGGFEGAAQRAPPTRVLPGASLARAAASPARPSANAVRAMAQQAALARRRAAALPPPTSSCTAAPIASSPARASSVTARSPLAPPVVRTAADQARAMERPGVLELARR